MRDKSEPVDSSDAELDELLAYLNEVEMEEIGAEFEEEEQ